MSMITGFWPGFYLSRGLLLFWFDCVSSPPFGGFAVWCAMSLLLTDKSHTILVEPEYCAPGI